MSGFRNTKSVKAILDVLEKEEGAVSVVQLVKQFDGVMNKTTVYRVLERLEQQGKVHSFAGVNGLKWFAKTNDNAHTNDHSHFQCQKCGKSVCLHMEIDIPDVPNYKIDSANLILLGQCGDCLS